MVGDSDRERSWQLLLQPLQPRQRLRAVRLFTAGSQARQAGRQAARQSGRQAGRQLGRQAGRQAGS